MAMHVSTVRFGDDLWEALDREARREGVSVAQFVRDAALLRIATLAARRGDDDALASLAELAARAGRRQRGGPEAAMADPQRVAAVQATGRIGRAAHPDLDHVTDLVRRVLNVPTAMVSLLDDEHQHVLSCPGGPVGAAGAAFPLSQSICRHAVVRGEPLAVVDAREEPLLADLVPTPGAPVVAYLGAPLLDAEGNALGSLCAIDQRPRQWTRDQVELLEALATTVVGDLQRAA
jgi:GAF domain-containing protein